MAGKAPNRRELERRALNDLRRVVRELRVAAQRAQSAAGISAAQLYVLGQLVDGSPLSINELAEQTFTDRSSVGAVAARLADRGLVERERAAEDRRRAEVRITAAGREALSAAPSPPTEVLLAGLKRLSEGSLACLAEGLAGLVAEMGLERAPAQMLFEEESPRRQTRRPGRRSGQAQE